MSNNVSARIGTNDYVNIGAYFDKSLLFMRLHREPEMIKSCLMTTDNGMSTNTNGTRTAKCVIASICALHIFFWHALESRAEPVEYDGTRVSSAPVQSVSKANKKIETVPNERSASTESASANSEGKDERRSNIEGSLKEYNVVRTPPIIPGDDKVAMIAQGMYYEKTVTGGPQGARVEQMWVTPKMMKSITKGQAKQIIVRLDKQLYITVDTNEKTYSEVSFNALEAAAKNRIAKMDSLLAELKNMQATMTDEQKNSMKTLMGTIQNIADARDEKITVRNTGETKVISGFLCTKTVMSRRDTTVMTLWATKDLNDFDAMREDWNEFEGRMLALSPGGIGIGEALKQIDGFPVQTETMDGVVNTLTKIERKPTYANEFEVPAGYKSVASRMLED